MTKYVASWSGEWPCLCHGEWTLYIDGQLSNIDIPFQHDPADTYGIYQSWSFDENWCEYFEPYESGLNVDAWCAEYAEWLATFAPEEDWPAIFAAFQAKDWRHSSCGGCI